MRSLSLGSRLLLLVYCVTAVAFVISIGYMPYPGSVVLKVVPILALLLLALVNLAGGLRATIVGALVFSAVGDISLEVGVFALGLGAFLVAQVMYAGLFFTRREVNATSLILAVVVVGMLATVSSYVLPQTGEMKFAVALYMTAIASMGFTAALHAAPSIMILTGAVAFIISDSMIGINRFVQPFDGAREWIMVMYYLAQALLVCGVIHHAAAQRRA